MPMTKPTSEQVTFLASGSGATQRTVLEKLRDVVSVKDFGAVGDGVADDTVEINAALASGAKMVHFPAGTYKVSATLNVPVNVSIVGDGPNASIIDGSSATYANLTSGYHINVAAGTWTALPALTTNPVAGASSLVFASAPSVSRGDIICIYNPTNGSWSGFRTYYRAGEYQRVAGLSGSTVTTQGSLYANYVAANVNLYRLTNPSTASISGIKLLGLADTGNPVTGINTTGTVDFVFENVVVTGCSYACIAINQAWNCTVTACSCQEDAASSFGGDYGIVVSNSTGVHVNGGTHYAVRHAITTGGGDGIGNVPNRMIRYSSILAMTGSSTGVGALDFHGNCEHCVVTGCTIDGGMIVGGDHITIDGNTIIGRGNSDVLILCAELKGTNLSITDNLMQSYYIGASGRGAFFDIGGNSVVISSDTVNGGTIAIGNNTMDWMSSSTTGQPWVRINNSSYTGTDISIAIEGNAITAAGLGGTAIIECQSGVTGRYMDIAVFNNGTRNCGLVRTRHVTAASSCASNVIISGNMVVNATASSAFGIYVQQTLDSATITNNVINGCSSFAAAVTATTATGTVTISGNTIIDGLNVATGSSTTDADIIVSGATNVACMNNVFGTTDANRDYGMSFDTVASLLLRDNTAWQPTNTGTYFNAITAYLPGSVLSGSATYDPPNLIDGAGDTTTVTVTGAALGDLVECVSFSLNLQGITVTGYVSAADTVSVRFQNESGGTLDLGSGTLLARVRKA
jgi:hypothetical protein